MNPRWRTALIAILAVSVFLGAALWLGSSALNAAEEVETSEFVELIESGQLSKVEIEAPVVRAERTEGGGKIITTADKTMPVIIEALNEHNVSYDEEQANDGSWFSHMFSIVFLIFIVVIAFFFWRNMRGAGGAGGGGIGLGGFTKDKAQRIDGASGKTFADVGGIDEAVTEVREIVDYLANAEKYKKLGGRMPKGVLLMGPPGVGKTLLARATAGEAGVAFYSVSGADFNEMFVGVGAARVRSLVEKGKKEGKCIIFIDELDSIGRKRGAAFSGGEKESENTLNSLLSLMDGVDPSSGLVFMGASNQPDQLDPALTRPGRFDRPIHVSLPDIKGREFILNIHINNNGVPLAADVNVAEIAKQTPGMSGADLENLVNEAAIVAARRDLEVVDTSCFSEASDKVMMGLARKSMAMTQQEKWITCVHEMGHALIGHLDEHSDPVQKVTAIPRGGALGVTMSMPEEDMYLPTKEFLMSKIVKSLGGRVAERLMLGVSTSGASSDLQNVQQIAWALVTKYGMSEMGEVAFGRHGNTYLGGEAFEAAYSEQTARRIDEEVDKIVREAVQKAEQMIEQHKDILLAASKELYERETLTAADLTRLLGPRPERPKIFEIPE